MIRRAVQALLTAVLALALTVGGQGATAAHAADDILISADGVTYSTSLSQPLFSDLGLLVPQDSETRSLWVKNPLTVPVFVRLSVANISSASSDFAESVTLGTSNDANAGTSLSTFAELETCQVLMASTPLAAGGVLRIDLRIDMLDVTGIAAQNEFGVLDFEIGMRDGAAGPFPASACEDGAVTIPGITLPSQIAHTGYDLPTTWLIAAGVFVGFGFLLVARRRRRRDES